MNYEICEPPMAVSGLYSIKRRHMIKLKPITKDNIDDVLSLNVRDDQARTLMIGIIMLHVMCWKMMKWLWISQTSIGGLKYNLE